MLHKVPEDMRKSLLDRGIDIHAFCADDSDKYDFDAS